MDSKRKTLGKHKRDVERFLNNVAKLKCTTEIGSALQKRIEKNRDKLFTFLSHNDVPWNTNNAEHGNSGKTGGGSVVFASLTRLPLILWRDGSTG